MRPASASAAGPRRSPSACRRTRAYGRGRHRRPIRVLLILAIGAWFLVDVRLGYDMPSVPWGHVLPIGVILIGLLVVVRGMGRRTA